MSETPYSNLEIANLLELGAATIKTQMATIKTLEAQLREKTEEIERLRGVHRAWINEDGASAELATARTEVKTLRAAVGHAWYCNHPHSPTMCDGCVGVERAVSSL